MDRALPGLSAKDLTAIRRIINQHGLTIKKVARAGPRFLVAEVLYRHRPAVFKICLQSATDEQWSVKKFVREIRFLDFLRTSQHSPVRALAPQLLASGFGPRPWYLREFIGGRDYALSDTIRFRPAFFTKPNLAAILRGFRDLQSIHAAELPRSFRATLHRYDTVNQWLNFLRPFWRDLNRVLRDPGAGKDLAAWIRQRRSAYDRLPVALAHQEPYAPHFMHQSGRLRLIDWENINWANPAADGCILWMRASGHPAWRADLRRGWKKNWRALGDKFDLAWDTDLLVRSVFTLLSARTYRPQADMKPTADAARQVIKATLTKIRR
jgi:hypothetical protein